MSKDISEGEVVPRHAVRYPALLSFAIFLVLVGTAVALLPVTRALAVLAFQSATGRPPLRLTHAGDDFLVDVQTLGEYGTSVTAVALRQGDNVVWKVEARDPVRLFVFKLHVGPNPNYLVTCRGGGPPNSESCRRTEPALEYTPTVPSGGPFVIAGGQKYRLEVWGSTHWWSRASADLVP